MLGRETQPNAAIQVEAEAEAGDNDDAELDPDQEQNRNDIKSVKIGPAAQRAGGRRRKATRK
jgi:hypothetical protein